MQESKICSTCRIEKKFSEFHKSSSGAFGCRSICKVCRTHSSKAYLEANLEEIHAKKKVYRLRNLDTIRARDKKYYETNKVTIGIINKERYHSTKHLTKGIKAHTAKKYRSSHAETLRDIGRKYRIDFPEKFAAKDARRRANKLNATPSWATKKYIDMFYLLAKIESKELSIECHVDHIVPLQSKLVCGLHNEFNLQVLPAKENMSKGNRIWPDMP